MLTLVSEWISASLHLDSTEGTVNQPEQPGRGKILLFATRSLMQPQGTHIYRFNLCFIHSHTFWESYLSVLRNPISQLLSWGVGCRSGTNVWPRVVTQSISNPWLGGWFRNRHGTQAWLFRVQPWIAHIWKTASATGHLTTWKINFRIFWKLVESLRS